MNLNTIWSALEESYELLFTYAFHKFDERTAELGLELGWRTWIQAIWVFDSEPFSTETYMRFVSYGSERVNEARFAHATKQGFLAVHSENEYQSTEKGKHVAKQIAQKAEVSLVHLQPMPAAGLQKILGYGRRLIEACLAAPEPPSKFTITRYYQNMHPDQGASLLRLFVHYFATLDQYRGAAHLDSWQDHNLAGYVWSVLTSIWRDEANTLETLHEEMGASVFSRDEILGALQNLTKRGWIEEESRIYRTTPEGGRIRQEAEELTDRYFFPPWACLNETEQADLLNLATQLHAGLKDSMEK